MKEETPNTWQNSKNTGKNSGNLIPWKKGQSGNPNGRPKGQRNYSTLCWEALIKIDDNVGKTPDEIEIEIVKNGILKAQKGDFRFWKEILDRLYGSTTQKVKPDYWNKKPITYSILDARAEKGLSTDEHLTFKI